MSGPRFFDGPPALPTLERRERNEIPGLARCTRCKVGKSPAEFRKNARKRNGLSSWCAACHTAATAAWREANPGQVEAWNEARRVAYRKERRERQEQERFREQQSS